LGKLSLIKHLFKYYSTKQDAVYIVENPNININTTLDKDEKVKHFNNKEDP